MLQFGFQNQSRKEMAEIYPPDRKWKSIDLWNSKWLALAAEVDELGETQIKEQFDAVLLRHIPKHIKEIKREELAGHILTLGERWNYISKQMKLSQLLGQIESEYHHHPTAGVPTGSLPKITKITVE